MEIFEINLGDTLEAGKGVYYCTKCGRAFGDSVAYDQHVQKCNGKKNDSFKKATPAAGRISGDATLMKKL